MKYVPLSSMAYMLIAGLFLGSMLGTMLVFGFLAALPLGYATGDFDFLEFAPLAIGIGIGNFIICLSFDSECVSILWKISCEILILLFLLFGRFLFLRRNKKLKKIKNL